MMRWTWLALCGTVAALAATAFGDASKYADVVGREAGLVARWRFDGDLADAKGELPGTAQGGDAVFADGPGGGKALAVAAGRFVSLGKAPALDLPETTVELWFRPDFAPEGKGNPCLVAKRQTSAKTRFSMHLWRDYSCLAFWNGREVTRLEPMGRPLKRGEWYHLAITDKGGKLAIYLDALPCRVLSGGIGFSLAARGLPLLVGTANAGGGAESFEGVIAEVAVYSRVLPPEAVARHMDAMGAKKRVPYEEIQARLERERQAREAAAKERLAELTDDKALFARGSSRVYEGEHLGAISLPVGGIGAGSIQIDGRAMRPVWQIFNNMTQAAVPNSFFAIRVKPEGGEPILRALQTEAVGPLAAMKSLTFRGEYPFGWFTFEDPDLPVQVTLEAFNPLIPLDLRSSAIPCAIYNVTVRNPGKKPVEVTVLAAQQNAVGYTGAGAIQGRAFPGYGGNANRLVRSPGATMLHMTAAKPGMGDMALAVLDGKATASAAWPDVGKLAADIADGTLGGPDQAGPTPKGQTADGALAAAFTLEPKAQKTVSCILAWHFPTGRHGHGAWGGGGNMYANWWDSALDVAQEAAERHGELREKTRRYHDALYASNLPAWLLDRLSSQHVVIRSQTTFWTQAGYFGGWEGCCRDSGCCHGNCNHVWHYAQSHARLWPELGRILREQELRYMADDGGIPHRQPRSHPAFDGQCGGILGAYREHLMSPDRAWLSRHWPSVKKATDYLIATWDKDGDGVLAGPQWNTLDGNLGGSTSWLGTLYLAALAASERMAIIEGDAKSAQRYRKIRESGAKKQDATLFNGDYYIQLPDPKPQQDYGDGCHIDQVLGQWWAHQLDLGWLYPPDHVRTALAALFKHNFRPRMRGYAQRPRKFVADDDPGMQMITWPKGDRPAQHMRYADEVMSGFEYSAAAAMVQAGLLREGFAVVHAAAVRYDGRRRTGLTGTNTASWGYSGNPFGDDECGKFYARPMSIWSMLLACQGFIHDGPAGRIGFKPVWRPDGHASFFTAAEGWGLFTQKREGRAQTDRLEVRYGRLRVKMLVLELPEGAQPKTVAASAADRPIAATHRLDGRQLTIALPVKTTVGEGQALAIAIEW